MAFTNKIFTCLVISTLLYCLPVFAQFIIQNLPNGRYLYCDNPPPNDGVSVVTCFAFEKKLNKIIGYYYPTNVKYATVCVSGIVKNNIINGEAVYLTIPINKGSEVTLASEFQQNQLKNWSNGDSGRLRLARALPGSSTIGGQVIPLVKFRKAELNLRGFKHYRDVIRPIPKSCLDWS
ncbi:hypothetical protein H6G41_33240 [Tolypothrix sp. FACHB-123]|uniref:hypothetical protein n=1 Tax=Tolypothrix sp. FACHB-123 TaxID=2692868 RepID=UPI0016866BF6|nr:hypothetical protein [Tolypothrix sp. FACHB-123]MBD2359389.1 hypothetical protein [Tolypothrix sp. FACHB-123]